VVMNADEGMTFWCFVQFMERMVSSYTAPIMDLR